MRVREALRASLVGGFLLAVLGMTPSASAVPRPTLAGTVRSGVGALLEGVEVLVLRERGPDPVAVVHTDPGGHFLVRDLPIGTYRVVAVKDGYATWLGRVSVALRTTLDLVLQPAVVDPTMDQDWVLRVPDRGLLRDTEQVGLLAPPAADEARGRGGPTIAHLESDHLVQGKVEHVFAFGADEVDGPRARMEGGETRLLLTSHPWERARLRVEGRRQGLDSALAGDLAGSRGRDDADLHLGVDYDTSLDGQLAVRAFYASRQTERPQPATGRAWGYDAAWARQLTPTSRLSVEMAYLDAGVEPRVLLGMTPLSSRALGARTIYDSRPGDRHQVRLGMRARSADLAALGALWTEARGEPGPGPFLAGIPDPLGWGIRFDAEDAWLVATPLTLVYAIGYEADVSGIQPALLAERAGVVWSAAGLRLDVRLTRHALRRASGNQAEIELPSSLGWSSSLELPVVAGLRVRAEALSSPVREEGLDGPMGGVYAERPLYLTDGMAATRQDRLTLEHEARHTRSFVQVARGSAEGRLAVVRPTDASVGGLDARRLDFVAGRLGIRVVPTGTDVQAEYRKVLTQASPSMLWADPVEGESIELRIAQDLVRLQSRGAAWRLLLAARATQEGTAVADGSGDGTQHWMGAGISLAF